MLKNPFVSDLLNVGLVVGVMNVVGSVFSSVDVVGGAEVLRVRLCDMVPTIEWINKEWETWSELRTADAFKSLVDQLEETMKKAKLGQAKGEGKGEPAP